MGYLQEVAQERDCLNEESDIQRVFTSIKVQKALIDVNNEFNLYCKERFMDRPKYRKPTKDHTKGGSD